MKSYNVIILLFGLFIFLVLVLMHFINKILIYKGVIDNSFVAIRDIVDEKLNIVDNIIEFVKNNFEYEKGYLKRLEKTRKKLLTIDNNKDGILMLKKVEKEMLVFFNLENTYKKLYKNKEYLLIKECIQRSREQLLYAVDIYDKGVINYNNYRRNKFIYYLSKLMGIPEYDCYNK